MAAASGEVRSRTAPKVADFTRKLKDLKRKYESTGLDESVIHQKIIEQLTVNEDSEIKHGNETSGMFTWWAGSGSEKRRFPWRLILPAVMVAALAVLIVSGELDIAEEVSRARCLVENNLFLTEASRPLMECGVCKDLTEFPVRTDISPEEFAKKYAYKGVPVLIKNATKDWSAMQTFTFKYFKETYERIEDALQVIDEECQFFPYDSEDVDTLGEAFNMSTERVTLQPGEKGWYIGWSNCHPVVAAELRRHYRRPFFLPQDSESSQIDWIFMGGSGPGADLHLDYVERPSWQAQISGTKTWTLVPVPECESMCHTMNITVHKGDIIVLDTNQWYHSTFIHPGELSICIGSEYD